MNNAPRVLLVGARGRMGRAVAAAAAKESGLTIKAELGRGDPIASENRWLRRGNRFQHRGCDGSRLPRVRRAS